MKSSHSFVSLVVVVAFSLGLLGSALAQEKSRGSEGPRPTVPILGTELRTITSFIVGQEYELYINLPRGYQDTSKKFPVLYLLDGQWDFPLVNAVFGEQYYDGFVPALVTVGITWGGKKPNYDSLRGRDLTPTNIKQMPQSGNAPKFLSFIKNELIPFIESNYRVMSDDRTLVGSSLGGLFTLYTLFRETDLFSRYVLTSPSVGWDNQILYTYENEYAKNHSKLSAKVFLGVGGLEGQEVLDCEKFVGQLRSRNYAELDLTMKVIEGIGHSGGKAEGYTRGLQAVFARPSITVSPEVLQQYVGEYQAAAGFTIEILKKENTLALVPPGGVGLVLSAQSENDFYLKGMYLFVHFKKDDSGKVTGFEAEQFEGQQFLKKIN
jgi:predicted alpha/beta superfamily hydrolase